MQTNTMVLFFSVTIIGNIMAADMSNFKIEESYLCEEVQDQKIKCFIHPKDLNPGLQLVDINMSVPAPIGNEVMCKMIFEVDAHLLNQHTWMCLFEIEDSFCKLLDRYVGELWYDMQRGMGMMQHSCPIPRGNYHAVNYLMDYQKAKIQTYPTEKIRLTINIFDKIRQDVRGCVKVIATMIPG